MPIGSSVLFQSISLGFSLLEGSEYRAYTVKALIVVTALFIFMHFEKAALILFFKITLVYMYKAVIEV